MLFTLGAMLSLSPRAHAFCGHYVGGDLTNAGSQMVVVRQGQTTVLTMSNDVQGDLTDFGLVIPVPPGVGPDDVSVIDPGALATLDAYTAPRLVSYTCDDIEWTWVEGEGWTASTPTSSGGGGCGGAPQMDYETSTGTTGGYNVGSGGGLGEERFEQVVTVERFTVGEYDVAVVDATGESGLTAWLEKNGFELGKEADDLLGDYIGQGLSFLAVRVILDEIPEDRPWLSPLQIRYQADSISLPIRLGTLSSAGEQDLVIYGIAETGLLGISSYPQVTLESECLLAGDLGEEMDSTVQSALIDEGEGASYILEYGWGSGKCDPCPPESEDGLDQGVLDAVGFDGAAKDAWVTRLHMRYQPQDIDRDLTLYESGIQVQYQLRYVQYEEDLESYWPVCWEGWADDPGSCPEPEGEPDSAYDRSSRRAVLWVSPLGLILAAGLLRRKRTR